MPTVALISDTHVPSRASTIPSWVRELVRDADHVVHAGDFDSGAALSTVRDLTPRLTAVAGNMDRGLDLRRVETLDLGGVRFVVTHGTGPKTNYHERVAETVRANAAADRPTVGVSGHTHQVHDRTVDGLRLLNPGSATGAAPATRTTMMTVEVREGDVDVTLHER